MSILIDLGLLAIVGFGVWRGYKRGIVPGVAGVVVILLACYFGNLIANTYADAITPAMKPFVTGYMDKVLSETVEEVVPKEQQAYSIQDIITINPEMAGNISTRSFAKLGVYEPSAEKLSVKVDAYMEETGGGLAGAVVEVMSGTFAYLLLFVILFALISILFTVLANVIPLSFRLPGLRLADAIGGASLGLIRGLLYLFIIAWVARFLGVFLSGEVIEKTLLLELFMDITPMSAVLGI